MMLRQRQKGVNAMAEELRPIEVALIGTRDWRYCHG
jgi:hypothetical protein